MVISGTPGTRTPHSPAAIAGFIASMALPAMPAVWGVLALGLGGIEWASAIVWGVLATVAFTLFMLMGKAMGMSRMDLLDLLGSMMAEPGSGGARALGGIMHLTKGALLAISWAYGVRLLGAPANVWTAVGWGVVLWILAMLMMTTMGAVHPAIRRGEQEDPGPAATHFGRMTPVGSLLGHVVYGVVLGLGYAGPTVG